MRIAWLLPLSFFYWQPTLSKLTELVPETTVFAALWPGHAQGFNNHIKVQLVGENNEKLNYAKADYDDKIEFLPISIITHLFRYKPNIVFSNSFGIWTLLALLFKFIGKWRVVIAYEGSSPGVDFRNSPIRLFMRRIMVSLADACISNSQAGKSYLIDILGAKANRVFSKPYEIPDASALQQKGEIEQLEKCEFKKPIFLFVGQVVPRKGVKYLLEACTILQQQGCDDYTVLIVGDGVQRQEMELYTQLNNLQNQVKWLGKVEYSNLGVYFEAADVFVLPTLEDTWGIVVQEAMILGKPVLCSERAGASELVKDGENGYLFDPEQPEKLASIMLDFISNPSLCKTMGENSQKFIANHTPTAAGKFLAQVAEFALNL